ncbi:DUF2637 domain-containing protein [Micromonospora sp. WMMA1923]|uniref:DUF2637 domain-containing protein n=1 Tax=Micromonospora sp. WMMA1923 TaxID=3404125 RepID=UPI003B938D72
MLRLVDRVRYRDRPTVVYLALVRTDALRTLVPPFPVPAVPDFTALPLARREDLRTWSLHLLATHVLVGGATRSGKGSVLWSLVRVLGDGIASGLMRLWVIDPKGGMEFALGRPMFARFACKSFEAMADLLDEAVTVLRERQTRLAGTVRVHTPTEVDPLVVVVIDEMAALTAYLQDVDLRKRIAGSLGLLLSQGAGVGVLVVAALQDPRKEVLPFRDLFPTRIALGLTEASQVDMVLGDGARNRGALADQMPRWAKGVGYVILDGTPDPMRVRFSYVSDDDIRDMARRCPAPADAADILAQVGRETAAEPVRLPLPRKPSGPLLPDALRNLLDQPPPPPAVRPTRRPGRPERRRPARPGLPHQPSPRHGGPAHPHRPDHPREAEGGAVMTERTESAVRLVILLAIGTMAGAAAFTHVHDLSVAHGQPHWIGWANAVAVELMTIYLGLELRARRRAGRPVGLVASLLVAFALLSLAAQVAEAEPSVWGWIVAAVPSLAFLALVKVVLSNAPATPPPAPIPAPASARPSVDLREAPEQVTTEPEPDHRPTSPAVLAPVPATVPAPAAVLPPRGVIQPNRPHVVGIIR